MIICYTIKRRDCGDVLESYIDDYIGVLFGLQCWWHSIENHLEEKELVESFNQYGKNEGDGNEKNSQICV